MSQQTAVNVSRRLLTSLLFSDIIRRNEQLTPRDRLKLENYRLHFFVFCTLNLQPELQQQ